MKSLVSLLLTLTLTLLLSVPAFALDEELPGGQESDTALVSSLEELIAAVDLAENGDTITLQNRIDISENCTIGQEGKEITLVPADDFSDSTILKIYPFDGQNIILQDIILDGQDMPSISALEANFYDVSGNRNGTLRLSCVQVQNFNSNHNNIYLNALSVTIESCQFKNNTARMVAGIVIAPTVYAEITDCIFSGNISLGSGGAVLCKGYAKIENSIITENQAGTAYSAQMGGGVCVEDNASCEIVKCKIVGNSATLGGGIAVSGEAVIVDTLLYNNQGMRGASDIRAFGGAGLSVTYSDGMDSIYTENNPVGFYADDFENPFDAESNAVFLGESLSGAISNNLYGAKFIFASDLPVAETGKGENSGEQGAQTEPQEPTVSAPDYTTGNDESDNIVIPSTPSRPSRPIVQKPVVVQPEETPTPDDSTSCALSCGVATLDTSTPIALLGYGDGQLHENDPITRAQIAVLLYRALTDDSKNNLADSVSAFADTDSGAWYDTAVNALASVGVIGGYNGLFHPADNLTLGQLITLLTRFVAAKETTMPDSVAYQGHWAYSNIVTAVAYGWLDSAAEIDPDRPVTRGEAVEFINSIFANS